VHTAHEHDATRMWNFLYLAAQKCLQGNFEKIAFWTQIRHNRNRRASNVDRWGMENTAADAPLHTTTLAGDREQHARRFHCDRTFQGEEGTWIAAASTCQQ